MMMIKSILLVAVVGLVAAASLSLKEEKQKALDEAFNANATIEMSPEQVLGLVDGLYDLYQAEPATNPKERDFTYHLIVDDLHFLGHPCAENCEGGKPMLRYLAKADFWASHMESKNLNTFVKHYEAEQAKLC